MLQQHCRRIHGALIAHRKFENLKFSRQLDVPTAAGDGSLYEVEIFRLIHSLTTTPQSFDVAQKRSVCGMNLFEGTTFEVLEVIAVCARDAKSVRRGHK